MFTYCSFDSAENEFDCYKGEGCMERFCKDLREHAMKIINYEKKEMIQLTDEENKFSEEQKFCYICKKEFSNDDDDNKKYQKEIIVITLENLEELLIFVNNICTLRYKTPKKIPVVFHNGSIYDYHFIIN